MKRRLLNVLTAVSLLLSVASAGLWVRSHWSQDVLRVRPRAGGGQVVHVFWQGGSIACTRTYNAAADQMPAGRRVLFSSTHTGTPGRRQFDLYAYWKTRAPLFHGWGFSVSRSDLASGALGGVLVPLWLPVLLSALLPAARVAVAVRKGRRRVLGCCRVCGYDLRATPGRCPECGAVASSGSGRGE